MIGLLLFAIPPVSLCTLDECVAPLEFAAVPSGYSLKQIQVITRHGARAPMIPYPASADRSAWLCDTDSALSGRFEARDSPRLVRVTVDHRLADYPPNCRAGDLTVAGMREHFSLGALYRSHLVSSLHFLPPELDADQLYIRATVIDRTFKSATSFLQGLYGPSSRVIDIFTGTSSLDILRPSAAICSSTNIANATRDHFFATVVESLAAPLSSVRTLLGVSGWNVSAANYLCDWVTMAHCNGHAVSRSLNATHAQICAEWERTRLTAFASEADGAKFAWAMREILSLASAGHRRFVLLSAHDSTLSACLSLLGHPVAANPPLASHLALQVLEGSERALFVRWALNGRPLALPEFGGAEIVPFAQFAEKMGAKIRRLCPEIPRE